MMLPESRPRVLVVDNVADAADMLALLLSLWGYSTETCYDGMAALAIARAYQPDAVLLDLGMPGMDGYEVARQLREQPGMAQTVLMAYTGYADAACHAQARGAGFQHYLLKPTDPEELHALLLRAVGKPGLPQIPKVDTAPLRGDGPSRGEIPRAEGPDPGEFPAELICALAHGAV